MPYSRSNYQLNIEARTKDYCSHRMRDLLDNAPDSMATLLSMVTIVSTRFENKVFY